MPPYTGDGSVCACVCVCGSVGGIWQQGQNQNCIYSSLAWVQFIPGCRDPENPHTYFQTNAHTHTHTHPQLSHTFLFSFMAQIIGCLSSCSDPGCAMCGISISQCFMCCYMLMVTHVPSPPGLFCSYSYLFFIWWLSYTSPIMTDHSIQKINNTEFGFDLFYFFML